MKKVLIALAALVGIAAPVALIATPAQAATGGDHCMTKAEWYKIREAVADDNGNQSNGMLRDKVTAIVGVPGKVTDRIDYTDGTIWITVMYHQCLRDGSQARSTIALGYGNWDSTGAIGAFRVGYNDPWSTPSPR